MMKCIAKQTQQRVVSPFRIAPFSFLVSLATLDPNDNTNKQATTTLTKWILMKKGNRHRPLLRQQPRVRVLSRVIVRLSDNS